MRGPMSSMIRIRTTCTSSCAPSRPRSRLAYNARLFEAGTIERLADAVVRVFEVALEQPATPIAQPAGAFGRRSAHHHGRLGQRTRRVPRRAGASVVRAPGARTTRSARGELRGTDADVRRARCAEQPARPPPHRVRRDARRRRRGVRAAVARHRRGVPRDLESGRGVRAARSDASRGAHRRHPRRSTAWGRVDPIQAAIADASRAPRAVLLRHRLASHEGAAGERTGRERSRSKIRRMCSTPRAPRAGPRASMRGTQTSRTTFRSPSRSTAFGATTCSARWLATPSASACSSSCCRCAAAPA